MPFFFTLVSVLTTPHVHVTEVIDSSLNSPTGKNLSHPKLAAHDPTWVASLADGLHYRMFRLSCGPSISPTGILPLALISGPIFGRFLVSLPYINTGGACAENTEAAFALVESACELADKLDVRYLELRHETAVAHPHSSRGPVRHIL